MLKVDQKSYVCGCFHYNSPQRFQKKKTHVLFIYELFPPSVFVIKKIFWICRDILTLWWTEKIS